MLKKILVVVFILFSQLGFAVEKAKLETIKEYLMVTNTSQTLEMTLAPIKKQLNDQLNAAYKQIRVKYGTNQQDELIKKRFGDIANFVSRQVAWESIEPMTISAYQEELTQKQLEEAIAFYKTDSGKAILGKVPNIFKRITEDMAPVQKKINDYVQENLKILGKELDDTIAQKK